MCGKPHWKSSIARRQNLSLPIPFSNDTVLLIKQLFHCFDQTFLQCPPYDSGSHQLPASYSQWSSRYRTAIIWTGDRDGVQVSIELPFTAVRTNPPNGDADDWLTTSIDSPAHPPLSHLLYLFPAPVACSALYPSPSSFMYCYSFSFLLYSYLKLARRWSLRFRLCGCVIS